MAILFLSISFYMMKTTMYTRALGDYVLEFMGLKSWSGKFSGTHYTFFYFGVLTLLGLYIVLQFAVEKWGIRKRWVLLLFIVFINMFTFITNATAKSIKGNSNGLLTVGFNSQNSKMEYNSKGMEYTDFNAKIELVNYSDERKEFYLTIAHRFGREDDVGYIDILTKDGNKAVFELEGNETRNIRINLNEYKVSGGKLAQNGGGKGTIQEVILTDEKDNKVELDNNNFFGTKVS